MLGSMVPRLWRWSGCLFARQIAPRAGNFSYPINCSNSLASCTQSICCQLNCSTSNYQAAVSATVWCQPVVAAQQQHCSNM